MKSQDLSCNGSIVQFSGWRDKIGISATTGWRWRGRGWINTITIAGRVYVTTEAIAEFERRAAAGEFLVPQSRAKVQGGHAILAQRHPNAEPPASPSNNSN